MSIESTIADRLIGKPGIIAVRVHLISNTSSHFGFVHALRRDGVELPKEAQDAHRALYERVLIKALALYDAYDNKGPLRIVQGDTTDLVTIACYADQGYAIAVALPTGDQLNKSLRRMLGRAIVSVLKSAA